jgi:hypothetical protein
MRNIFSSLLKSGLIATGLALPPAMPAQATPGCAVPASDQAWIDKTIQAWRYTRENISRIQPVPNTIIVFFSATCRLSSKNALFGEDAPLWSAIPITDHVPLPIPGDQAVPISVIARAQDFDDGKGSLFVMSTPTIWRAAKVPGGTSFDLETLMTAVMLHEATHVSQGATYMAGFSKLAEALKLPEDWTDDSLQKKFEKNKVFSNSIAQETNLLFAAAAAKEDREAIRLARRARTLIAARRAKYYRGSQAQLGKVEDLFLTLEGSAQWVGFSWLIDKSGANISEADALAQFARRANWWSQVEGAALTLAINRLDRGAWRTIAFGNGKIAGVELLDQALENTAR